MSKEMQYKHLMEAIDNSEMSANAKRAFETVITNIDVNKVTTPADFDKWAKDANWSDSTYNHRLRIIKTLNSRHGVYPELAKMPVKKKVVVNSHEALSPEEYELLVNVLKKSPSRYSKAILLLLSTGVRYSELAQIWNVDRGIRRIQIVEPKTKKRRMIPLIKLPDQFYERYDFPKRPALNVFLRNSFDFKKTITCHSLRASFITYMYYSGMSIECLALLMGKVDQNGNPIFQSLLPYLKLRQEVVVSEAEDIFARKHLDPKSKQNMKIQIKSLKRTIAKQNRIIKAFDEKSQLAIYSAESVKIHNQIMKPFNSKWKRYKK